MTKWISVKDRLPEKVDYKNIKNCLIPTNYKIGKKGYISCKREGFCKLHRYTYYLNNNEGLSSYEWIKKNKRKVIMHSCDNPSCINPRHLSIGTQIDNIKDRVKKGRSAYYESNGNHKLKKTDVQFIRYYHGKRTTRELSEFFNVDKSTIRKIQHNKSWMPLPAPPEGE
jgi:transposase-like protein